MEYRNFGNTKIKVSVLGFGAMRLPEVERNGKWYIDEAEAIKLIHKAFEYGINYIDTAYPYCHEQGEIVVGRALGEWKGRIYVSTKSPVWRIKKTSDFRYYLEESLKKLDLDFIDFYHFHSLTNYFFNEKVLKLKLIDEALKAKDEGLIKHISFSFHDEPEVLKKLVDTGAFETVLCQYSFLHRANKEAMEYAAKKGVGVAVMGPLAGGRIPNLGISSIIRKAEKDIIELAFKFVFSNRNVSVALSGMSNLKMLEENIKIANMSFKLTEEEINTIEEISGKKEVGKMIPCNDCGYCIPCPNDIPIPKIFKIANYYTLTGIRRNSSWQYSLIGRYDSDSKADECIECGECEEKCPQNIKIIEKLKEAHKVLS